MHPTGYGTPIHRGRVSALAVVVLVLCCHLSGFCHVGSGGVVATHNTRKDVGCVIALRVFKEQRVWGSISPAFVLYESPAFHISTNQRLV